ncbi:MAG: bacillithiol system protein YtxJ [Flavobacteriales bacterium]|jgi:bacillithiol system protein YtxJ
MNWTLLTSISELESALAKSEEQPIAIFKHSTRCSVSFMARKQLEMTWDFSEEQVLPYFLDLIQHRDISNAISSETGVEHQSPQLLLIIKNKVAYHASHGSISLQGIQRSI